MEEDFTGFWKVFKKVVLVVIVIVALLLINPMSCVGATDRGVRYLFGKPGTEVLMPGVHLKVPLVGKIKKWSIVPNKLAIDIPINDSGAISKDNQIIGTRLVVYWKYDDEQIYKIATEYSEESIKNLLSSQANAAIKTIIGTYTIFALAENQLTIGDNVKELIVSRVSAVPIKITQINISNFNWNKKFDEAINATMEAAQQVKRAEQQASIAEQEMRRLSIEAEAKAKALEAEAGGELAAAKLRAEAKKVEGQAIAEYNRQISTNLSQEIEFRKLEIQLERAKRWNGIEVPTYLPLNPAGGIVTLPSGNK